MTTYNLHIYKVTRWRKRIVMRYMAIDFARHVDALDAARAWLSNRLWGRYWYEVTRIENGGYRVVDRGNFPI